MKKVNLLGFLALLGASQLGANDVSRSYFNVRPYSPQVTSQSLLIDQTQDTGRVLRMNNFEATVFGGRSTREEELAKYFFFDGKTELVVKEDDPATDAAELTQDILSLNFNLDTAADGFHSTITIAPQQTFWGVMLSGRMPFRQNYWLQVEAPIIHVENDLQLDEKPVNLAGGASAIAGINNNTTVGTMKDAFRQAGMLYGKIDGVRKETRLADLTLKLGYDCPALNRKDLYMSSYVGVVLPTGNKAKGKYMFEPICGNGGHVAFMLGSLGQLELRKFKNGKLWLTWGAQTQYLFENTQKRSFDLVLNGPWSRYLSMYPTDAKMSAANGITDAQFGINLLTLDAKVTPGYNGMFETGISYVGEKCYGGLNYSTFVRQAEKVALKAAFPHTEATIADYEFIAAAGVNHTQRFRRIGTEYIDSKQIAAAASIALKEADLDLNSAAHPGNVSYLLSANMGYHHSCKCRPYIVEGGASYEFSRQNTSLNRWGLYGKFRISF